MEKNKICEDTKKDIEYYSTEIENFSETLMEVESAIITIEEGLQIAEDELTINRVDIIKILKEENTQEYNKFILIDNLNITGKFKGLTDLFSSDTLVNTAGREIIPNKVLGSVILTISEEEYFYFTLFQSMNLAIRPFNMGVLNDIGPEMKKMLLYYMPITTRLLDRMQDRRVLGEVNTYSQSINNVEYYTLEEVFTKNLNEYETTDEDLEELELEVYDKKVDLIAEIEEAKIKVKMQKKSFDETERIISVLQQIVQTEDGPVDFAMNLEIEDDDFYNNIDQSTVGMEEYDYSDSDEDY
jgi:hypothetical protein